MAQTVELTDTIDENAITASQDEALITEHANFWLQMFLSFLEEWGNCSLKVSTQEDLQAKALAYQRIATLNYMMGAVFIRAAREFGSDEATQIARDVVSEVVEETVKAKLRDLTKMARKKYN